MNIIYSGNEQRAREYRREAIKQERLAFLLYKNAKKCNNTKEYSFISLPEDDIDITTTIRERECRTEIFAKQEKVVEMDSRFCVAVGKNYKKARFLVLVYIEQMGAFVAHLPGQLVKERQRVTGIEYHIAPRFSEAEMRSAIDNSTVEDISGIAFEISNNAITTQQILHRGQVGIGERILAVGCMGD